MDAFNNDYATEVDMSSETEELAIKQEGEVLNQDTSSALQTENLFAEESSFFTRPNRFLGPPSTWQTYTQEERLAAQLLDSRRSSNLAAHLYNAFMLKRILSLKQVRSSEAHPDEVLEGSTFEVPAGWTAWPLPPGEVPRDHETESNSSKRGPLEEALLAISLRYARQRWDARPLQSSARKNKRDWEHERQLTGPVNLGSLKQVHSSGTTDVKDSHNKLTRDDSSQDSDNYDSEGEEIDLSDDTLPQGIEGFSSQAFRQLDSSSESGTQSPERHNESIKPSFLADDDRARQIMQPAIRHIASKVDDLLAGLHKARRAYARTSLRSKSRSKSRTTDVETDINSSPARTTSRGSAPSRRGRKRKRSDSDHAVTNPHESATEQATQSSPIKARDSGYALGLRDWSDVIGMATLKGWNMQTIARASERCAKLFNQNMTFRTFQQPDHEVPMETMRATFSEEYAYVPATSQHEGTEAIKEESIDPEELALIRTSPACTRCHNRKFKCLPPPSEPTSNTHNPPITGPCLACTSCTGPIPPCSGITYQHVPILSISKCCPHPTCPRHTQPFKHHGHVLRHLDTVHQNHDPFSATGTPRPSPVKDDPTDGPGHCPVRTCKRHYRPYSRQTLLYKHIAAHHPEIDLQSFKKNANRRGWGKQNSRSRSRSVGSALRSSPEKATKSTTGKQVQDQPREAAKSISRERIDDNVEDDDVSRGSRSDV